MIEIILTVSQWIGIGLCAITGLCAAVWLIWLGLQLICLAYQTASYRFRSILKAEELIKDFRREREQYEKWKSNKNEIQKLRESPCQRCAMRFDCKRSEVECEPRANWIEDLNNEYNRLYCMFKS